MPMTALCIVDLLVRFVLRIQLIRVIIQIGTIRRIVRIVLIRPIIQLLLGVRFSRDFAAAHVYLLSEPKKIHAPVSCMESISNSPLYTHQNKTDGFPSVRVFVV